MQYKVIITRFVLICFFITPLYSLPAIAASPNNLLDLKVEKQSPITITSDSVELDNKQQTAVHKGNVVVKQGEITIYCDTITTSFDKKEKRIKPINAKGNIRMVHLDRTITAEAAIYYDQEKKIILTGNPVCTEHGNVLSGSRIIYLMNDDKIIVENAKSVLQTKSVPKKTSKESKQ